MLALLMTPFKACADARNNHTLHNEIITVVNRTTDLSIPLSSVANETYQPNTRRWNGISSIITAGDNIFAAWQTGGTAEPDPAKLNYVVVAASTDGGKNWIDPFIVIDPPNENQQTMVPMFYRDHEENIHLMFCIYGLGPYRITLKNADDPLENIEVSVPSGIGTGNACYTKPTLMPENGRIIYAGGGKITTVFQSTNGGRRFREYAYIDSNSPENARVFSESVIIRKLDGTLWHLRRLEKNINGGIEQSFSYDDGKHWTKAEGNMGYPFYSPGSRFALQRLQSGALLFITNAAGVGACDRRRMTAYLSRDDGSTWEGSLLLEEGISSYPDFWQDDKGMIHVIYDVNRFVTGGIAHAVFTEEDVLNGTFSSPSSKAPYFITKLQGR